MRCELRSGNPPYDLISSSPEHASHLARLSRAADVIVSGRLINPEVACRPSFCEWS
ncbi:hypothetical protein S58_49580 [Bradyrhizobium oligotrophicum S58]|uniref:Uncharacterized protein n=1 Tax=Bradyrhizobium oligotrophicum S58 TaxID=1245469 RepID=M4ZB51_9BRAD|nr:hypothetical protein S58_49580 [Bradyrhizobium oligotrophicum S58]